MPGGPFSSIVGQRRAQALLSRGTKLDLALGPWPKGVFNNPVLIGPSADGLGNIPEGALSFCLNLDIMEDGSLATRRGFVETTMVTTTTATNPNNTDLLGEIEYNQIKYGLVATRQGVTPTSVLDWINVSGGGAGTSAAAAAGFTNAAFSRAEQYNNKIWLVSSAIWGAAVGKSADISSTHPPSSLTWVDVPNMPRGDLTAVVRDRLFIANMATNRLYWSKATDFTIWAAPDGGFVDVSPNDGSPITGLIFDLTNIYIFKADSVWLFSFTSDPAVDGYLRKIFDFGAWDALYYKGEIYGVNNKGVFSIKGSSFNLISNPINISPTNGTFLARIEDLLLVADNSTTSILTAVFNTRTGTWTYYDNGLFAAALGRHSLDLVNGQAAMTIFSFTRTSGSNVYTGYLALTTQNRRDSINWQKPLDSHADDVSATQFHKPKHVIQTKRYSPTPDKLFKVLYPKIHWKYSVNGGPGTGAQLKLLRSMNQSESPTALDGSILGGVGATFTMPGAFGGGAANDIIAQATSADIPNHRYKTVSTIAQLLIPKQDFPWNVIDFVLELRNIMVSVSFPGAEINDLTNT